MKTKTEFDVLKLVRENILNLKPYSSARGIYGDGDAVLLDANENPFGNGENLNRYPDPLQNELKKKIAERKGINPENIFLGNGSDEAIDLLMRIFCRPSRDSIIILPPTYGMYEVSAAINDVRVVKVQLQPGFKLPVEEILKQTSAETKILFICSPNNPTANVFSGADVRELVEKFPGIVVVDEAYIDFADVPSTISEIENHENLVVLQTLSKAWGLAGARLGMAFAGEKIIKLLNNVKPPYNISELTQQAVLNALDKGHQVEESIKDIIHQRKELAEGLRKLEFTEEVFPSDANFLLVKVRQPKEIYQYLKEQKVIVRDRSNEPLCEGCLRITVGTPDENALLLRLLPKFNQQT